MCITSDIHNCFVYLFLQELCQIQKDTKVNPLLHATMYLSQKVLVFTQKLN
jgi:hypothetical protein